MFCIYLLQSDVTLFDLSHMKTKKEKDESMFQNRQTSIF